MLKRAIALVILAGLLVTCSEAHAAAAVTLSWTNPSTNTDGSALTNLADIIVTYGPCSTDHTYIDGARGTPADFVIMTSAAGAQMTQTETIPGKGDTCFVAVAQNTIGQMSAQSNVAVWTVPLPTLGQPAQLSQVINFSWSSHHVEDRPAKRPRRSRAIARAGRRRAPHRLLRPERLHAELLAGSPDRRG